jgi:hypothetical protein
LHNLPAALYRVCLIPAFLCASSVALGQVDTGQLVAALSGKTVVSTVTLGYQATTRNPVMVNGRPARFQAKTEVFPDGRVSYRVESGILHADADKYWSFKPDALFQITKVEAKSDCLEVEMGVSINSTIPDPKLKADVKLMLGKDWQHTMTTEAVLKFAGTYLPDTETLAKTAAAAEASRAEAAETARIAAEQARAEAQAKADTLAAQRREESEKKIPPALLARAKAGDAEAQYEVGHIFASGDKGIEKDDAVAFFWFQKSAEQGNAKGENGVGASYEYGNGVAKNYTQALDWFRKAADQGNADAQHELGYMYENGGVPKDYAEAMKWFRKAADQGDADAQRNIGTMYENGYGVPKDYSEAMKWFRKAADQGDADAQEDITRLNEERDAAAQQKAADAYRRTPEGKQQCQADCNSAKSRCESDNITKEAIGHSMESGMAAGLWLGSIKNCNHGCPVKVKL